MPTGGASSIGSGGGLTVYTKSLWAKLMKQAREYAKDTLLSVGRVAGSLAKDYIQKGIGGLIRGLAGMLIASLSVSGLVSSLIQGVEFVWNFDWNISDKEINQERQYAIQQGAGLLGGALGVTVGQLLCGQIANTVTFKIDPSMAIAIREEVSEEAFQEIVETWKSTANQVFELANEQAFYFAYENIRRTIKKSALAEKIVGRDVLKAWGDEDSGSFSFAQWQSEQIQKIPNPNVQSFVEEFTEELWDSCKEAFMVVANAVDSQLALSKSQLRDAILGEQRIIELTPNREEGNPIRIYTHENLAREAVSTTLASHQVVSGYDLGEIVEGDTAKYISKNPHEISIKLFWSNRPTPPYSVTRRGEALIKKQLTIPGLKRSGWTWREIQNLMGGKNGIVSGKYKCWVKLSNGSYTKFFANNKQEAESTIRGLIEALSDYKITRMTVSETKKTETHNEASNNFHKEIKIYPWKMTIMKSGLNRQGRVRSTDDKKTSKLSKTFYLYYQLDNEQLNKQINDFLQEAYMDRPSV